MARVSISILIVLLALMVSVVPVMAQTETPGTPEPQATATPTRPAGSKCPEITPSGTVSIDWYSRCGNCSGVPGSTETPMSTIPVVNYLETATPTGVAVTVTPSVTPTGEANKYYMVQAYKESTTVQDVGSLSYYIDYGVCQGDQYVGQIAYMDSRFTHIADPAKDALVSIDNGGTHQYMINAKTFDGGWCGSPYSCNIYAKRYLSVMCGTYDIPGEGVGTQVCIDMVKLLRPITTGLTQGSGVYRAEGTVYQEIADRPLMHKLNDGARIRGGVWQTEGTPINISTNFEFAVYPICYGNHYEVPTPTPEPGYCEEYEYESGESTPVAGYTGIKTRQGECSVIIPNWQVSIPALGEVVPAIDLGLQGMSICPTYIDLGSFSLGGIDIPGDILALPAMIAVLWVLLAL